MTHLDSDEERKPSGLLQNSDPGCLCGLEGPDSFGNYDLIEHPDCELHSAETSAAATPDHPGEERT